MNSSLAFATIDQLRALLDAGEITVKELVEYYVARFREHDETLGSALEIFDVESIIAAVEMGDNILAGIPGLIKDNIAQKNRALTCASRILEGYSAVYDATVITRLKKTGVPLIGRANMDEFAMGSSTTTSAYKKCVNPWDHSRVPGGSSGGSAVAVAAGLVPWALGSETGGSVRQPAAFCGIVGLKPTYGSVSRYGLVAYASSLDQIGVFARTTKDVAHVFSAIAGYDMHDSSSYAGKSPNYLSELTGKIRPGMKIGIIDNALTATGIDPEVSSALDIAIEQLRKLGATVSRVSVPTMDYSAAAYFIISRAEAASNLSRFDGVRYGKRVAGDSLAQMYQNTRHDGFGTEVRRRILIGNYVLSAGHSGKYYQNAKKVQLMIRHEFDAAFKEYDLLFAPTSSVPAFRFGAYDVDPLQMDLQDYFTCPVNLAGIPAISVPCGITKSGLPIGMQLIAPHHQEALLFQVAHAYELATEWHTLHPGGY